MILTKTILVVIGTICIVGCSSTIQKKNVGSGFWIDSVAANNKPLEWQCVWENKNTDCD